MANNRGVNKIDYKKLVVNTWSATPQKKKDKLCDAEN